MRKYLLILVLGLSFSVSATYMFHSEWWSNSTLADFKREVATWTNGNRELLDDDLEDSGVTALQKVVFVGGFTTTSEEKIKVLLKAGATIDENSRYSMPGIVYIDYLQKQTSGE